MQSHEKILLNGIFYESKLFYKGISFSSWDPWVSYYVIKIYRNYHWPIAHDKWPQIELRAILCERKKGEVWERFYLHQLNVYISKCDAIQVKARKCQIKKKLLLLICVISSHKSPTLFYSMCNSSWCFPLSLSRELKYTCHNLLVDFLASNWMRFFNMLLALDIDTCIIGREIIRQRSHLIYHFLLWLWAVDMVPIMYWMREKENLLFILIIYDFISIQNCHHVILAIIFIFSSSIYATEGFLNIEWEAINYWKMIINDWRILI